jgi:ABC-type arginine transport system permease subunit
VILPQAVRACLPPLASQYVNVIKASSLAAAIGFPDLMQVFGKTTRIRRQAVEVIVMTMAVYLAIAWRRQRRSGMNAAAGRATRDCGARLAFGEWRWTGRRQPYCAGACRAGAGLPR